MDEINCINDVKIIIINLQYCLSQTSRIGFVRRSLFSASTRWSATSCGCLWRAYFYTIALSLPFSLLMPLISFSVLLDGVNNLWTHLKKTTNRYTKLWITYKLFTNILNGVNILWTHIKKRPTYTLNSEAILYSFSHVCTVLLKYLLFF